MGDDLWLDGDPFEDGPTLPELLIGEPCPAKDYVLCPLEWLARVRPLLRSTDQLYQIPLIRTRGPIGAVRWT